MRWCFFWNTLLLLLKPFIDSIPYNGIIETPFSRANSPRCVCVSSSNPLTIRFFAICYDNVSHSYKCDITISTRIHGAIMISISMNQIIKSQKETKTSATTATTTTKTSTGKVVNGVDVEKLYETMGPSGTILLSPSSALGLRIVGIAVDTTPQPSMSLMAPARPIEGASLLSFRKTNLQFYWEPTKEQTLLNTS